MFLLLDGAKMRTKEREMLFAFDIFKRNTIMLSLRISFSFFYILRDIKLLQEFVVSPHPCVGYSLTSLLKCVVAYYVGANHHTRCSRGGTLSRCAACEKQTLLHRNFENLLKLTLYWMSFPRYGRVLMDPLRSSFSLWCGAGSKNLQQMRNRRCYGPYQLFSHGIELASSFGHVIY